MNSLLRTTTVVFAIHLGCAQAAGSGAAPTLLKNQVKRDGTRILVENRYFRLRMIARTPEQIAAFYYARGFPKAMIDRIVKACFITTGITNKSDKILWMDLADWQFTTADKRPLRRFTRRYWFALWKKMQIPLRFQSTFRWTLIPKSLDYRPQEREGGNITLARTSKSFSLTALFHIGDTRHNARPLMLKLPDIRCAATPTKQENSK